MRQVLDRLANMNLRRRIARLVEAGWMKVTLLLLSAVIVIVVLFIGGVFLLADGHPFMPGHPLYGLQFAAESIRLELIFSDFNQAEKALTFADQRLVELEQAPQDADLGPYAERLDSDLSLSVRLIFKLPLEERDQLIERLAP